MAIHGLTDDLFILLGLSLLGPWLFSNDDPRTRKWHETWWKHQTVKISKQQARYLWQLDTQTFGSAPAKYGTSPINSCSFRVPVWIWTLIHTRTYKIWRFQLGTADLGAVEPQTKLQASLASRTLGLLGSEGGGPWFGPVDLFCAAKNYTKLEFQPIVGPKRVLKLCWAGRLWSSNVKLQDFETVCATGIRCNDLQCTLYILAVLDLVFFFEKWRLLLSLSCLICHWALDSVPCRPVLGQRVSSYTPTKRGINIPCRKPTKPSLFLKWFSWQKKHPPGLGFWFWASGQHPRCTTRSLAKSPKFPIKSRQDNHKEC
jgi:hypothetical protein